MILSEKERYRLETIRKGVNLVLVEDVLRVHLPLLRSNIDALLA